MHLSTLLPVMYQSEHYMSDSTKFLHELTLDVASLSMYVLELLSIILIVYSTVVAFWKLFRHEPYARVYLLHGQSIGLSFKLGAEILRTVTATSLLDIVEVFLLIVIKACMVMLIERELKSADNEGLHESEQALKTPHVQHTKKGASSKKYSFEALHHKISVDPVEKTEPSQQ